MWDVLGERFNFDVIDIEDIEVGIVMDVDLRRV